MNKKEIKILYSIRIPQEQLDYLRNFAEVNFTTVTQCIIDLINAKMKNDLKNE
jgi:hypothetical protein